MLDYAANFDYNIVGKEAGKKKTDNSKDSFRIQEEDIVNILIEAGRREDFYPLEHKI